MENNMKEPKKMSLIINVGMAIVITLYFVFALVGYLVYGDAVAGSITLNMPNSALFTSVKVSCSFEMFFARHLLLTRKGKVFLIQDSVLALEPLQPRRDI